MTTFLHVIRYSASVEDGAVFGVVSMTWCVFKVLKDGLLGRTG